MITDRSLIGGINLLVGLLFTYGILLIIGEVIMIIRLLKKKEINMIRRYRTPESIKKRLDLMIRNGEVILDHGCGSYDFDHYDYYEPSVENNFESKLIVYYKDFDANKTVREYMTVTEDNL